MLGIGLFEIQTEEKRVNKKRKGSLLGTPACAHAIIPQEGYICRGVMERGKQGTVELKERKKEMSSSTLRRASVENSYTSRVSYTSRLSGSFGIHILLQVPMWIRFV